MSPANRKRWQIIAWVMLFFGSICVMTFIGFWVHRCYVIQPVADKVIGVGKGIRNGLDIAVNRLFYHKQGIISCTIGPSSKASKLVTVERVFQHSCEFREPGALSDKYARLTANFRVLAGIDLETGEITVHLAAPQGMPQEASVDVEGRGVVISCEQVGRSHLTYSEGFVVDRLSVADITQLASRLHQEARAIAEADPELKRLAEQYAREFVLSAAQGKMPEVRELR